MKSLLKTNKQFFYSFSKVQLIEAKTRVKYCCTKTYILKTADVGKI